MGTAENSEIIAKIIEAIEDIKGENIILLDLTDIDNAFADYFIICDGTSNTQVSAISRSIDKKTSKELKVKPWHVEGSENAEWILLDYLDIIVHVFQKETRDLYQLEELWGDAKIKVIN